MLDQKNEDSNPKEEKSLGILGQKKEQFFFEKRIIILADEVNEKTAKEVIEKFLLLEFDKPKMPIHFYINSPGGSVTDGMAIYDTMQLVSSPVHTICIGLAASMGSLLLSGGKKKYRFIFPHAEVMIHQPLLGGRMQAVSKDLEIEAEQMEKTKHMIVSILAKNTGNTIQKVTRDIDRNYWMSAEDSLKYGIVDQVFSGF